MPRASEFAQDIADTICQRIADGESLRAICRDEGMPPASTVCTWLSQQAAFSEQYARAREAQADTLFDEILEIADESSGDTIETENGPAVNHEAIARSKLRVDARKWMAGKLRPKVYGEKVQTELTGPNGGPVQVQKIERVIVDPANPNA